MNRLPNYLQNLNIIESVYRPETNIPSKLANHSLDFDECNDKSNKDIAKHNIITFLSGNNTRSRQKNRISYYFYYF